MSVPTDDPKSLASYYETHNIPVQFSAGFVVLSVVVSLIGTNSTLLLLGRRTSNSGWRNLLFLVLAGTTTSAVGIWSMHFIGMHLKLRPTEDISWYIHFDPGFTVFSLFLPLILCIIAFWFLGSQAQVQYWRIFGCGVIFGGIVGLMHYSASFYASFVPHYRVVNLVFSIVIAIVASSGALLAFFRFRERWQDVWWKRLACGFLLATAVCAMHYVAVSGTSWTVRPGHYSDSWQTDKNADLAYAIAGMCAALCLLSAGFAVHDIMLRKSGRLGSQQLVVASAAFTRDGKILVKPDGNIPLQVMSTNSSMREILRELDIRSTTFSWIYSLTWDWTILDPFLHRIAARILNLNALSDVEAPSVQSIKEAFILASQGLANELYLPPSSLGILFDKALPTGASPDHSEKGQKKREKRDDRSSTTSMAERGYIRTPDGVMLILVRELPTDGPESPSRYISEGFRLSEPRFLVPMLSERLGVDRDLMGETLEQLRCYARRGIRSVVQPQGVYASLFALRQMREDDGQDEVLVYNFARHQIPAFRLPEVQHITDEIKDWLKTCKDMSLDQTIFHARAAIQASNHTIPGSEQLKAFQASLIVACDAIIDATRVWPNIASLARISTEVLDVPSSSDELGCAHMISFNVVLPEPLMPHQRNPNDQSAHLPISHSSVVSIADGINDKQRPFVFTPLSLFKAAQACLFKGPSSVAFAQRTHNQLSAWYPSEVPISFTSSSSKNSFALDEKGASEPSTTPLYGSDPFSSLHFSPSPDAYQMEEKPPGAGMPGAVADESKLGRKPSTPTRTKRVQPLVYEGDPKPDLLHIQPPRPAKSPKRASNRPVPPKYPDEAVPDPSPPLSNHPFRTSQRLDNAQSNEVSTPAPAHLRTSVSEALPSHPWSSDYLTPREQARLVNLQDAAIVRRSNYDWAERAANELKKAPEEP